MPGTTTYLDTPVVPVAAFTGPEQYPTDCELPAGTPKIYRVDGPGGGPYVSSVGQTITITSQRMVDVPNPAYCPGPPLVAAGLCNPINTQKTVSRDFGFGSRTTSSAVTLNGVPLRIVTWGNLTITAVVQNPSGTALTSGQLMVRRGTTG
jgi:hypothetical protein